MRFFMYTLIFTMVYATISYACPAPPAVTDRTTKHGYTNWQDENILITDNPMAPVAIPTGWQPVGADLTPQGCAFFPKDQAVIFINPQDWEVRTLPHAEAGITLHRYAPKGYDPKLVALSDTWIMNAHRRVRQVYPLGLLPNQKQDHHIIILTGRAGDGSDKFNRIFPNPGPYMTPLYRPFDIARAQTTFIHTTSHLFNKRRPRPETQPHEPGLPLDEYMEFVASWSDLILNDNPSWMVERTNFLYDIHLLMTDGDPQTAPDFTPLSQLKGVPEPVGIPKVDATLPFAVAEYLHYALSPLLMVALDGLLQKHGGKTDAMTLMQDIHTQKYLGLLDAVRKNLPKSAVEDFHVWLRGGRIPQDVIDTGLEHLKSRSTAYRNWVKPAEWP